MSYIIIIIWYVFSLVFIDFYTLYILTFLCVNFKIYLEACYSNSKIIMFFSFLQSVICRIFKIQFMIDTTLNVLYCSGLHGVNWVIIVNSMFMKCLYLMTMISIITILFKELNHVFYSALNFSASFLHNLNLKFYASEKCIYSRSLPFRL